MSKFEIGDKVKVRDNSSWGRNSPVGLSPTWGGVLTAASVDGPYIAVYTASGQRGQFSEATLELVEPTIEVGDKVLVAFEGVVSYVGDTNFYELILPNGKYRYADAEHTTLVKKAEPVSTPGTLYVDDNGDRFFRTDTEEWIQLTTDGDYHWHKTPVAPLTAFEAPLF